jgi:hypothetical protein
VPEYRDNPAIPERDADHTNLMMPVRLISALVIAVLACIGIVARYDTYGDLNFIHSVLSLFSSVNLLICYWEVCLYLRRDSIETRPEYWRHRRREPGRKPIGDFLVTRVALTQVLSPTLCPDVWATYSPYDGSYADRRTFGYNVDIANGFVTPVPTLILYAAYTVDFLPALFVA